jgi:hypothetical protein
MLGLRKSHCVLEIDITQLAFNRHENFYPNFKDFASPFYNAHIRRCMTVSKNIEQILMSVKQKPASTLSLEGEAAELGAEGVHLLGADLVLLLPHGPMILFISDEPRSQLAQPEPTKQLTTVSSAYHRTPCASADGKDVP